MIVVASLPFQGFFLSSESKETETSIFGLMETSPWFCKHFYYYFTHEHKVSCSFQKLTNLFQKRTHELQPSQPFPLPSSLLPLAPPPLVSPVFFKLFYLFFLSCKPFLNHPSWSSQSSAVCSSGTWFHRGSAHHRPRPEKKCDVDRKKTWKNDESWQYITDRSFFFGISSIITVSIRSWSSEISASFCSSADSNSIIRMRSS